MILAPSLVQHMQCCASLPGIPRRSDFPLPNQIHHNKLFLASIFLHIKARDSEEIPRQQRRRGGKDGGGGMQKENKEAGEAERVVECKIGKQKIHILCVHVYIQYILIK